MDTHAMEARWRREWEARPPRVAGPKFYNLVEFPYPSGEGLHVGHVFKYSGADAYGRYQRMRGHDVFQPMGWDAFGIHSENYALKLGVNPRDLTGRTTERFRAQLSRGGMQWDWDRLVDTSSPSYYRWTQWLLVQFFRAGLMYQAEAPVVWCPSCLTVLAREQTEAGDGAPRCERCHTPVTERVMRQWFLRMTRYADRLLDGLDALDWPERAKRLQRAWIGRSEGREIDFGPITVFTTRPDTLPCATFVAVPAGDPRAGTPVPHPLTGEPLPVVEADYVLGDYGTGAVMGVPAHDERDARFAAAHGLPVVHRDHVDDAGRPAVRHRLRDWLISRQRYWGPPIPIMHCSGACGPQAVPEDQLPVLLPDVDDFRPTGTGLSPLAAVEAWVRTTCPSCRGPARRETDVSDTFVDSSWYFLRYPSTDVDDRPWDPERTARMLPVDFYAGGPEHVQRHHLYARFVTMALYDLGLVGFEEPFARIRLGGLIVHNGARMSKSRGNVVTPDEYVEAHGADVLRCALLFSAPWQQGGDFTDEAITGVERFFARIWRQWPWPGSSATAPAVRRVTAAIEEMKFNVGLAVLMETAGRVDPGVYARLLAPFAPHLAEELWARLGREYSVHQAPWPEPGAGAGDAEDEVTVVVQVDGKRRDTVTVARGTSAEDVLARSKVDVAAVRVVFVPDRIVNLVTR